MHSSICRSLCKLCSEYMLVHNHHYAVFFYHSFCVQVDEDIYPEAYRKAGPGTGRSKACSQPFLIGHIEQIFCPKSSSSGVPDLSQLQIRVRKFYRSRVN